MKRLYFYVNTGIYSKGLELEVHHMSGFEYGDNGTAIPVVPHTIWEDAVTHNQCRVTWNSSIGGTCGRFGVFRIVVKVKHGLAATGKISSCSTKHYAVYTSTFTILEPDPLIVFPPITDISKIVCPSPNTELELESHFPNQNGARWYEFGTNNILSSDYHLTTSISNGEVKTYQVAYTYTTTKTGHYYETQGDVPDRYDIPLADETCTWESVRIPLTVAAVDLALERSPRSTTRVLCAPAEVEINLDDASGDFDGVHWYSDVGRTNRVHTGFTLKKYFSETTTLFTEFFRSYGGCESRSAIPGDVKIIVVKNRLNEEILNRGEELFASKLVTINDYRDFEGESCLSDQNFYTNLTPEEPVLNNPGGSFGVAGVDFTYNVSGAWYSDYDIDGNTYRLADGQTQNGVTVDLYDNSAPPAKNVCADHVGLPEKEYGSRTYHYKESYNLTYKVQDENGVLKDQYDNCPVTRRRVDVFTRPIKELCSPLKEEDVTTYAPQLLNNCDEINYRNICEEDDNIKLGPTEDEVLEAYSNDPNNPSITLISEIQYSWDTNNPGLSSYIIANPTTTYDGVPSSVHELYKYTLTVTYVNLAGLPQDQKTFCEILYKCDSCEPAEPETLKDALDPTNSL